MSASENKQPILDLSKAPNPSEKTLRRRQNIALQAVKFAGFSVTMVIMVVKSHFK